MYAKSLLLKSSQDYHPNPSYDLDHSPNHGIHVFLAPISSECMLFNLQKKLIFRHRCLCYEYAEISTLHGYTPITPLQFPFSEKFCILGSCNGIFGLWKSPTRFRLWNPSIRRILTPSEYPEKHIDDPNAIAFGFDPISDDYKIVVPGKNSYVYAMKTSTWCAIASPPTLLNSRLAKVYFVNGVFHWIVDCDHPCIIICDLNTPVFGTIPLPEPLPKKTKDDSRNSIGRTTIQGSLAVYATGYDDHIWIWVRKDASWFLVHKWKENQVGGRIDRVFELTTNSDLYLYTEMEGFQVYNPRTGSTSRRIHNDSDSYIFEILTQVESLNLLDMGTAYLK